MRTPPPIPELPARRDRAVPGGPALERISVRLEVVTPIMGGAARVRSIDEIDVIRAASLRGQLRQWWRALYGSRYNDSKALYKAESALWGRAAENNKGGRSLVDVRVKVGQRGEVDTSDVQPFGANQTPGAYAVWPARSERGNDPKPAAPRRQPGTRFRLELAVPKDQEKEVRAALKALILFGGYGGRTRRGCGTLTVVEDERSAWLPTSAEKMAEELKEMFDGTHIATDTPSLRGAALYVGSPVQHAGSAWTTALKWLSTFRQGESPRTADNRNHARESGAGQQGDKRPGRSNWPESDKVRQLSGPGPWAHTPLHNATPVWPRAGFGLPIIGQFQQKDRQRNRYAKSEPAGFELRWRTQDGTVKDRLASPLIVKALPLADGNFVPCALWLNRSYPQGGQVGIYRSSRLTLGSTADFDVLVAPGETERFDALAVPEVSKEAPGRKLRAAFLKWISTPPQKARKVFP